MRSAQHHNVGEIRGKIAQRPDQAVHLREQQLSRDVLQRQRMGEVVDVLRGACEVYELEVWREVGTLGDPFLDEVLDGFDVVIGGSLDRFDSGAVGWGRSLRRSESMVGLRRSDVSGWQFGDAGFVREMREPSHFDRTRYRCRPNSLTKLRESLEP